MRFYLDIARAVYMDGVGRGFGGDAGEICEGFGHVDGGDGSGTRRAKDYALSAGRVADSMAAGATSTVHRPPQKAANMAWTRMRSSR